MKDVISDVMLYYDSCIEAAWLLPLPFHILPLTSAPAPISIHPNILFYLYLFISPLPACLPPCLSIYLSIYMSASLCPFVGFSAYPSACLPICLFVCFFVCLSICVSVSVSLCLSV